MKTIQEIIDYLNKGYFSDEGKLNVIYDEDLPNGEAGLNRDIFVEAENGSKFIIEWWKNILYVKYQNAVIPCDDIEVSNTWPNNSRLNFVAKFKKEIIFILPIRDWELENEN